MLVSPFIVVSILMVFVLILFSTYLFYKGRHIYSNVMLGIYLLSQVIGILSGIMLDIKESLLPEYVHLFFLGVPVVFTWQVLYYFFICSLTDTQFRIKARHLYHFIPAVIILVILSKLFYFKSSAEKIKLLDNNSSLYAFLWASEILFTIQIITYNTIAIFIYYRYRRKVKALTNIKPEYDTWIRVAIFSFLIACIVIVFGKVLNYFVPTHYNFYILSNVIFLFFYSILFFVTISSPGLVHKSDKKEKYWYSNLTNYEAIDLMNRLNDYINKTQIYRKSGLTLKELASGFGANERHLSQTINDIKGQNYYDFINYYRVEHAKGLLAQNKDNRRTMFDIFWESGFNSKTTFNTTFKKITGATPSDFQKKTTKA